MKIKRADAPGEIEEVRRMFREYETFLGVDLCFQGFEAELADLPGNYSPPSGALLIGLIDDNVAGCVALRDLGRGVCEMKRLFVRPRFRGLGFGRELSIAVIELASRLGYSLMRLDTLDRLTEAMRLYERLGFHKIDAYYNNPLPEVVNWELDLKRKKA